VDPYLTTQFMEKTIPRTSDYSHIYCTKLDLNL